MAPEELCVDFKKMDALIDSIREQENNNYLDEGDSNAHSSYGHERRRSAYLRQVRRVSFLAPPNFQEERGAVSDFANPDHRRASRVTRRSSTFASNPLDRNSFDDNNGKRISRRFLSHHRFVFLFTIAAFTLRLRLNFNRLPQIKGTI